MSKRPQDPANVWPEALAVPCPGCDKAAAIEGMRPDGRLVFYCPTTHGSGDHWLWADSWTSDISWVNPHLESLSAWTTDVRTRLEFMSDALTLFLRSGGAYDGLTFQGTMSDEFVRFEHLPGGDGGVVMEVSSRLTSTCPRCSARPLGRANQQTLVELGFAVDEWQNYSSENLSPDPDEVTAMAETVFRRVFDQPHDYGILARFRQPAMAEAFYLGRTFGIPGRFRSPDPA